jgi:hypothetical protein
MCTSLFEVLVCTLNRLGVREPVRPSFPVVMPERVAIFCQEVPLNAKDTSEFATSQ